MTDLDPAALEAAARFMCCFDGKCQRPSNCVVSQCNTITGKIVRAYLAARREAGWVEAPLEATDVQMEAAKNALVNAGAEHMMILHLSTEDERQREKWRLRYRAMLSASKGS